MADMPSDFWSGWIIGLTVVSLLGLTWLVFSIYFSKNGSEEFESPVWDETLKEGNHPAPMWWFWMILATLIISVVYLMLYPGMGSYAGMLKWSQNERLDVTLTRYAIQHAELRQKIAESPIQVLQQDSQLMTSAQRLFQHHCAACHGSDGTGQANAFPNLVDNDWQWGSSEKEIEHTLRQGRTAIMVGWKNALGDDGVSQVIDYVKSLSNGASNQHNEGKQLFEQYCTACHAADGSGNPLLGAPNLTDNIWLYGDSDEQLRHTIEVGRNGIMPAFDDRLGDAQIRLLVAWLLQTKE